MERGRTGRNGVRLAGNGVGLVGLRGNRVGLGRNGVGLAGNGVGLAGNGVGLAGNGVKLGVGLEGSEWRGWQATVGRMKGWGRVSLVCPYFEVYFLAFNTKCHFNVNVSPREKFTKFSKILV